MKTIKRLGIIIFSVLAMFSQSAHAQIPVTDVLSIAQQIQMVANTVQQLTTMGQQLNTMNQQLEAMKGSRGMGGINQNENRDYLPKTANEINSMATQGSSQYAALSNQILQIAGANKVLSDAEFAKLSPQMRQLLTNGRNNAATQSAIAATSYNNAAAKTKTMQALVNAIDSAADAKAIADLQARIGYEQAMIENDAVKLAQATQLQAANEKLQDQQMTEQLLKMSGGGTLKNSTFRLVPPGQNN